MAGQFPLPAAPSKVPNRQIPHSIIKNMRESSLSNTEVGPNLSTWLIPSIAKDVLVVLVHWFYGPFFICVVFDRILKQLSVS
jgi:hypothetical protein